MCPEIIFKQKSIFSFQTISLFLQLEYADDCDSWLRQIWPDWLINGVYRLRYRWLACFSSGIIITDTTRTHPRALLQPLPDVLAGYASEACHWSATHSLGHRFIRSFHTDHIRELILCLYTIECLADRRTLVAFGIRQHRYCGGVYGSTHHSKCCRSILDAL